MTSDQLINKLAGLQVQHPVDSPELAAQNLKGLVILDEWSWKAILTQLENAGFTIIEKARK